MLFKRVLFFFLCFYFFFVVVVIHSMDTKTTFYFFTLYRNCTHACKVTSVLSYCLWPMECRTPGSSVHEILQAKIRVSCHILLQRIFPTQELNQCLLCPQHWQAGSLQLASPAKPILLGISIYQDFQFSPVNQSCPTLWDPMDCSMPSLPVHHKIP